MATFTKTISINWRETGKAALLYYRVLNGANPATTPHLARTQGSGATQIYENPAGSGIYKANISWDNEWANPCVVWDDGTIFEEQDLPLANVVQVNGRPAAPLGGLGAFAVTVTVTSGGAPVVGANVRMSEGAGTSEATTDAAGVASFSLNAGTYSLGISKAGFTYAPTTQVVTAAGNIAASMTGLSITPAAGPGQTTGYLVTYDGMGLAKANVTLTFRLVDPSGTGGAWERRNFTATSDANGLLQVTLARSSVYEAKYDKGDWVRFTTGDAATYALPEVFGNYAT